MLFCVQFSKIANFWDILQLCVKFLTYQQFNFSIFQGVKQKDLDWAVQIKMYMTLVSALLLRKKNRIYVNEGQLQGRLDLTKSFFNYFLLINLFKHSRFKTLKIHSWIFLWNKSLVILDSFWCLFTYIMEVISSVWVVCQ